MPPQTRRRHDDDSARNERKVETDMRLLRRCDEAADACAMTRAIAIVAPPYRETSGGRVVLHRLHDVLLRAGVLVYMIPLKSTLAEFYASRGKRYGVAMPSPISADDIVIYPDIVRGNPFNASRVVRWQLYHPRHPVAPGDRVFYYVPAFGPGPYLRVTDPRLELFNTDGAAERSGFAWTWRKAERQGWKDSDKPADGKELPKSFGLWQTANLFRSVERFVSYDNATFLTVQARLCGAFVEIRSKTPVDPYLAQLVTMDPAELRAHLIQKCADEDAAAIATCRELLEWK